MKYTQEYQKEFIKKLWFEEETHLQNFANSDVKFSLYVILILLQKEDLLNLKKITKYIYRGKTCIYKRNLSDKTRRISLQNMLALPVINSAKMFLIKTLKIELKENRH